MTTLPENMIEDAKNVAYETCFHHSDFPNRVNKAFERVAEEYVR